MGKIYEHVDSRLRAVIEDQVVCVVATAPLSAQGGVPLPSKGGLSAKGRVR